MNQTHEMLRLRRSPPPQIAPEDDDDEIVSLEGGEESSNHLTKNNLPDRRFKGQRDLPLHEVQNPHYRRPSRGSVDEVGIHRTVDGKPDRRFQENRHLTEEDAEVQRAEYWLNKKKESQH